MLGCTRRVFILECEEIYSKAKEIENLRVPIHGKVVSKPPSSAKNRERKSYL